MSTGLRSGSVLRVRAADGVPIAYAVIGGGLGTPILLIAGTGYAGGTWPSGVVERLGRDRPVLTFDHRGTGASGAGEGMYTTRLFASDAAAVVDDAGLAPVHVIGHSMGGRVAQWLALDRPDLVASLVLVASGGGQPAAGGSGPPSVPYHTALGIARDGYRAHLRGQIESTFFTPEFAAAEPERVQALVDAFWRTRPDLAEYLKHVVARQGHSTLDVLHRIGAPTLVVVGTRDTHAGGTGSHWDQSRLLAERIPGATFLPVEGLAHGLFWQDPDRTLSILSEWLDR
jgi:pimeloyl-ACP methyl ester carboxylesterase